MLHDQGTVPVKPTLNALVPTYIALPRCSSKTDSKQEAASSKATRSKQHAACSTQQASKQSNMHEGEGGSGVVNYGRTDGARGGASAPSASPLRSLRLATSTGWMSARESATQSSILSRDSVGLCPSLPVAAGPRPSQVDAVEATYLGMRVCLWLLATNMQRSRASTRPWAEPHLQALQALLRLLPELWQHRPVHYCTAVD